MFIIYSPQEKIILDAIERGVSIKSFNDPKLATLFLTTQSKKMEADRARRKGLVVNEIVR